MLNGGGRSLEDMRTLKSDSALSTLLKLSVLPSTDAVGDWLRRTGAGKGLAGLSCINRRIVATRIRQSGITAHTLDGVLHKSSLRRKQLVLPTRESKGICR
jgi:hypothetical protein